MSITELSIKRPLAITIVFVVLILFGFLSYRTLNYELLPKFDAGIVTIATTYSGASPEEVETSVTKPIEDAVSTVEGIDVITSKSKQNVSIVTIQLKNGVDDIAAQQDIERKINQIKSGFPDNVTDPVTNRVSSDQFPVMNLSVTAAMSDADLYHLVDKIVVPALSNVEGAGQITKIGGVERELQVKIDNRKLSSYSVSIDQIYRALKAASVSLPSGDITSQHQQFILNLDADITSAEMIRNIIIRKNADGSCVYLKDMASVSDENSTPVTICRINGKNGIGLQIYKTNDANAVEVSKGVKAKLEELSKEYTSDKFVYTIANDQSITTLASAHAVFEDLILAVLIVSLVMLVFLHSIRSSTFVLVAIPSALIPTFIMMKLFGFSLNLMTLTAMSLVIGILVDDSIVILENIVRHLEMGKNKVQASLDGRREISFTAIAITTVDLVVFIPMAMTTGLIGNIVRQFALTVVFSTLMSLLVSFTITPMLAAKFGGLTHLSSSNWWGTLNLKFESYLDSIKSFYETSLRWVLFHKRYLFVTVFVLILSSIALVPSGFIGTAFMDNGDEGEVSLKIELSSDRSLYQTNIDMQKAEAIAMAHPEVVTAYTLVGTQTGVTASSSSSNFGEIDLTLTDKRERKVNLEQFGRGIRDEMEQKIPGVKVTVLPTNITGSSGFPIQLVVKGSDLGTVIKTAALIKDIVKSTPGTDYVAYSTQSATRQIRIVPDRDKINTLGFSIQDISQYVNLAFNGNDKVLLKNGDDDYRINLQIDDSNKKNLQDVRNLMIVNSTGASVRLYQLASIEEVVTPTVLQRTNRFPSITINAAAVGRPIGSIVSDIDKKIAEVKLPSTISLQYLGSAKNQKESFASLGGALLVAILLIYFVMVALYESLIYPFVVLFSVPVAITGIFLALGLTMNNLTIFTLSGIIMLLGLVAKNGILIVDFANHLKLKGLPLVEILVEAGKERLRPIIMTTFAMILGMLPMALSQSPGAEVKTGMAWVIIGGLTSSFIFTLFLVPAVYMVVEKIRLKFNRHE
jgi:HAE1 family hydrophobic/amphiphilic exporter-1